MTTPLIGDGRVLRVCDLCGGVDDGPRHIITAGPDFMDPVSDEIVDRVLELAPKEHRARLLRELQDRSAQDRHRDCCREAGCPDGDCDRLTAGVEHLRDGELLDHLVGLQSGTEQAK